MAYLEVPRFHFAGQFQATVPTINNRPDNYLGEVRDVLWNPDGTGAWRIGGRVTGVHYADAVAAGTPDPLAGGFVLDAGADVSAKLVDLDPEQQMVSEIWGLVVRVLGPHGELLLTGSFAPVAFFDLSIRCPTARGMESLGAFYQSVLEDVEWHAAEASPLLAQLRDRSPDRLSIKFNVDGFHGGPGDEQFTYGRLVGTIGAAPAHEPRHFVAGRQLAGPGAESPFFPPAPVFAPALVDGERRRLSVDLGNCLTTTSSGGPLAQPEAHLNVAVRIGTEWFTLFDSAVTEPGAYDKTAAIVDATLDDRQLAMVEGGHLGVLDGDKVILEEDASRLMVRADQFVFRLNPGDECTVELAVTEAGRPPERPVGIGLFVAPLGQGDPVDALSVPARVDTDGNGRAAFVARAGDPRGVRASRGLDGQVFGISWTVLDRPPPAIVDRWASVSVLVWDEYPEVEQPTWYEHVEPIFSQYHKLYPVMARIVDLSDYDSVLDNLDLISLSFGLPVSDPNHMPVTRDLSRAKHEMLRRWFQAPLRGHRPPTRARFSAAVDEPAPAAGVDEMTALKSGQREADA